MYIKAYFILAHKNPTQIQDLITLLDDGKSVFFVHLDKKVDQRKFNMLSLNKSCHFVENRVACTWGKFSLVQATINGMKEIQIFMDNNFEKYNYHFIMLSGEDLPLKNNSVIDDFLQSNIQKSYLNYWALPYKNWWNGGLFRFENLYFFEYRNNQKLNSWINRIIKKFKLNFILPINKIKKNFPDFSLYGASQWMILSKDLMQFVVQKNKENPKFNSIFKYVLAPDETYFATLILNYIKQKPFIVQNYATHLVMFNKSEANPKYLDLKDIDSKSENFLFARKFDSKINQKTIDTIKKNLTQ